ncbi:hypothetical protein CPB86DRAFT_705092 [Serendipita vermifera]|nr:hypothetical protein CPB86DRAFT_705092 [Serendipita vermifera]
MSSTDLLSAGTTCAHESCRTIDFLPFKCSHCSQSFCNEHWKPTDHNCKQYDAASYDRIVPQCPFCSKPVLVQPQEDPNIPMERHIDQDCAVFTGKKKRGPVCGFKKCGKSLISPITCEKCQDQFCPAHRFPNTHACKNINAPANTNPRTAASTQSGLAALKRATNAASSSAATTLENVKTAAKSSTTSNPGASSSSSKGNLFKEIKTDRCETSPSDALIYSPTPRLPTTPTLPPNEKPKIIPDPTKKWVPAALFASA